MMKLRSGTSGLYGEVGRWSGKGMECQACEGGVVETVVHFVGECSAYEDLRGEWRVDRSRVLKSEEDKKVVNENSKSSMEFTEMVLGGVERKEIVEISVEFLGRCWERRKKILFSGNGVVEEGKSGRRKEDSSRTVEGGLQKEDYRRRTVKGGLQKEDGGRRKEKK